MHRVLKFTQNNWLTPHITLNSEKRQAALNKFEESFYKLMNNADSELRIETSMDENRVYERRKTNPNHSKKF